MVADYLAAHVDDRIDRRVKSGAKDRGDIGGLRVHGHRVVVECKNVTKPAISAWLAEAEVERGNDDALVGIVAAKRHGKGHPEDQLVHMTLGTLVALLTGSRDHLRDQQTP
jgi:hypothetical protein